jgi:hypothetical protein
VHWPLPPVPLAEATTGNGQLGRGAQSTLPMKRRFVSFRCPSGCLRFRLWLEMRLQPLAIVSGPLALGSKRSSQTSPMFGLPHEASRAMAARSEPPLAVLHVWCEQLGRLTQPRLRAITRHAHGLRMWAILCDGLYLYPVYASAPAGSDTRYIRTLRYIAIHCDTLRYVAIRCDT